MFVPSEVRPCGAAGCLLFGLWMVSQVTISWSPVVRAAPGEVREVEPLSSGDTVALALCRQQLSIRQLAESIPDGVSLLLDLEGSLLDPQAFAWLGDLGSLEELSLVGTGIGDRQLQQVCQAPRLMRLDLRGAPITKAAVPILAGVPELRWLDVRGTILRRTDVAPLEVLLPELSILCDQP